VALTTNGFAADDPRVDEFSFPWRLLGELLVEQGLVAPAALEDALVEQRATGRRLGEILVSRGALDGAQLTQALAAQYGIHLSGETMAEVEQAGAPAPYQPLGRLLVAQGTITQETLEEALATQRRTNRRLGDVLVGDHGVSMLELAEALGEQQGFALEPASAAAARSRFADGASYEVKEPGRRPLFTTDSFREATDFAFEYLAAARPRVLEIVRHRDGRRERVWQCDQHGVPTQAASAFERYGFDPNAWRAPGR
jgi:hypothetical protein